MHHAHALPPTPRPLAQVVGGDMDQANQDPSFEDIALITKGGCDLWRGGHDELRFESDVWTHVELHIKLNTPGQHDGLCSVRERARHWAGLLLTASRAGCGVPAHSATWPDSGPTHLPHQPLAHPYTPPPPGQVGRQLQVL